MNTSREDLYKAMKETIIRNVKSNEDIINVCNYCQEKYNVPTKITRSIISRFNFAEQSEPVLYYVCKGLREMTSSKISLEKFFTELEIRMMEGEQYVEDTFEFPLRFKMLRVGDNQFIGTITTKELMKLRKAQIIFYNENTQRALKKATRGGRFVTEFNVNMAAVRKISDMLREDQFVPNTLTFNIPEDEFDYRYDEKTSELIFNSIDHFDILDGYHRYLAICSVSDEDPNFNYQMEFRITAFPEDKAKNFIFQEDQKTKMRQADIDSYNMNSYANIIVSRINESTKCDFKGLIKRNAAGIIDFSMMADVIQKRTLNGLSKDERRKQVPYLTEEIIEGLNGIAAGDNGKWLSKSFGNWGTIILTIVLLKYVGKDKSDIFDSLERTIEKTKDAYFGSKKFTNPLADKIESFSD